MHHKLAAVAAAGAVMAALPLIGVAGAAASHSGTIAYQAVAANNAKPADVVTGALKDHGTDKGVGKNGQEIILSRGTFTVDTTRFHKSFNFKMDKKKLRRHRLRLCRQPADLQGHRRLRRHHRTITVRGSFTSFGAVSGGKCNLNRSTAGASAFSGTGHVSY